MMKMHACYVCAGVCGYVRLGNNVRKLCTRRMCFQGKQYLKGRLDNVDHGRQIIYPYGILTAGAALPFAIRFG